MRNIVLICLDTVRADFFNSNADTLLEVADVNINQCRAASAWSTPSHASMLTGELPYQHGAHTYQRSFKNLSENNTFLSDLSNYNTLGVSANTFAGPEFGFDKFFDEFRYMSSGSHRFLQGLDPVKYNQRNESTIESYSKFLKDSLMSDKVTHSLLNGATGLIRRVNRETRFEDRFDDGAQRLFSEGEDLVKDQSEPFFLFMNLMDAHLPLKPHQYLEGHGVPDSWSTHNYDQWEYVYRRDEFEEYWHHREKLYAATIRYLSNRVVDFIHTIRDLCSSPVSFVITADHGENLGLPNEDGVVNHTSSLSEGVLHVPLSIVGGTDSLAPSDDRIVSHLDLPKLLSALANETSFNWPTTPKAEVMGMGPNPEPPSDQEFWDRTIRCIYEDKTKYVWDSQGNKSVYEINLDRQSKQQEVNRQFISTERIQSDFSEKIIDARNKAVQNREAMSVSELTESRLEDLGYL